MKRRAMYLKFLFDQGSGMVGQAFGAVNTSLLIVATSDRVWKGHTAFMIVAAFVIFLAGSLLLGWAFDKLKLFDHYNDIIFERNEKLSRVARMAEGKESNVSKYGLT